MKKTLLAIVIPAMLATSAQAVEILKTDTSTVDFYGQMRTELKFTQDDDVTLGAGSSRSGVKASYVVNDSLSVFGTFEFGLGGNKNSDDSLTSRLHYAGVETDFGKFSFGKQWVIADDIYGAEYSYFYGGSGLLYATLSGALHSSLIKYNLTMDNFWVAANAGLAEDDANQSLYELFAGTTLGDLNLHAGFGVNTDDKADSDTEGLENTYFEATAEYTIGDALVGFTYYNAVLSVQNSDAEVKSNAFNLAATYSLTDSMGLYTGLELVSQSTSNLIIELDDSTNLYLGADYQINEWSKIYAEYGYSDGDTLGFTNKESGNVVDLASADKDHKAAVGFRVYW